VRRPRPLLLVVLGVVLLAVTACGSQVGAGQASEAAAPDELSPYLPAPLVDAQAVAIVGDSITERGAPVLHERLGGEWALAVDGASGFRVAEQLSAAAELASGHPDQVVVNLGTNDVLHGKPPEAAVADLRQLVGLFPDARCVHVVTINEQMALVPGDLATPSMALNAGIRALADADPRIDVVDWAGTVRADDADQHDEALVHDTVHPSARGDRVLADLYADALAGCR